MRMVVSLSHVGSKTGKKIKNAFFACFRPYIQQPDNHIDWATLLPYASIYPTNPRTSPWNFCKKNIEKWWSWISHFFESAILNFFFQNFSQWKSAWLSYEVSFISALGMDSSESWKRLHSSENKHDCSTKLCLYFFWFNTF